MPDGRLEFDFQQCLGKGGFGEVYLATVTRPGGLARKAAVKVLKENLRRESEAVKRLQDEGRMLATLDHPSILRAQELTRINGRIALIMEYVEGIDLARCTKRGRLLPPRVIVGAMGKVADALHCALNTKSPETGRPLHLIHRDIKPENIRLSVHGQVKLLDFGIARTTEMHRNAHTQVGDLPFTPGYAAPEAYTQGVQGPASDVYALGVTLYRLTVGERLYEGMDLGSQVTVAALEDRYRVFLGKRLGLVNNEDILGLLQSMLAYEAEDRPTAVKVLEACEDISDRLPGPTLIRWARSVTFPPPRSVKDASLTGQTLREDTAGLSVACDDEADLPIPVVSPPAPQPPHAAAEKKGPPPSPGLASALPSQRSLGTGNSMPPAPPPVPASLSGSVRPDTMPFVRPASGGALKPAPTVKESVPSASASSPGMRALRGMERPPPSDSSASGSIGAISPGDDLAGVDTTILRGERPRIVPSTSRLMDLLIVFMVLMGIGMIIVLVALATYIIVT